MTKKKKLIATIISTGLVASLAIGGTLAWLQDVKEDTQTFTGGDHVLITSVEHSAISDVRIIPGKTVAFDPTINVDNTVDAYVFVQISGDVQYLALDADSMAGWTALDGVDGVYYREVSAKTGDADNEVPVFSNGTVSFSSDLTNDTIPTAPVTISVKGYAIQKDYVGTVSDAWAALNA